MGNGLVYSSRHLSDDEAASHLLSHLPGKPLIEPRFIQYTSGRRTEAWVKNCIAFGLSAGFLEPLESTSIHLIQKGVLKLLQFMPEQKISAALRNSFNRQTADDYDDVRDFVILHYKANERDGASRSGTYCRGMMVSERLRRTHGPVPGKRPVVHRARRSCSRRPAGSPSCWARAWRRKATIRSPTPCRRTNFWRAWMPCAPCSGLPRIRPGRTRRY